jgi:hypothetical protein
LPKRFFSSSQENSCFPHTSLGVVLAISIPLVVLIYQSAQGQNRQLSPVTIRRVEKSSIVLDLPDDLLDDVLLSWLTLSDLAKLDKALLKTRARARVLMRLVSAGPLHCSIEEQRALHKSKTHTAMLLWVQKRGLRLDGFLFVTSSALMASGCTRPNLLSCKPGLAITLPGSLSRAPPI